MRPPHAICKGYLTDLAEGGVDKRIVGDRVDADPETLEKHYDNNSDRDKMRVRRELIEQALDEEDEEYGH